MRQRFADLLGRYPELGPIESRIDEAFELLRIAYSAKCKVLLCGNGGSAADAEHIVGELMKGMSGRRPIAADMRAALAASLDGDLASYLADHLDGALPAVSLVSQSSLLTAVANDMAGDMGFAQQVHGYGRPGDVLWALSTSGASRNVVLAAATARASGVGVLALTGEPGLPLGELADVWMRVPSSGVATAQELHRPIYHALCSALEREFFTAP